MAQHSKKARAAAALVGVGAVVVATVLPGSAATAENSGDVVSQVTRAVLIQANADGDINRATLITQISLDGQGQAQFTVPVGSGGSPKNMDGFGGPSVVDNQAQYDVNVDGPQVIRTSQNFDKSEIPVTVSVEATLDGQPMPYSEVAGKSGLLKLTYTFDNQTSEPTQLSYKDALGNTITEEHDIAVPMAGSVNITFPDDSWGEISAPTASVNTGDGTGGTLVSATVPLLPDTLPEQSTTGTFEVEARVNNAVLPPADIKFAIIPPDRTPDIQSSVNTAQLLYDTTVTITEAGTKLGENLELLRTGLQTAADGARQIADGVSGQLGPGVEQLSEGLTTFNDVAISTLQSSAAELPESVRSDPSFSKLTDGFDAVNSALEGVRDGMGTYKTKSSQKPGPWLKDNGDVDTGRADVARTLWGLIYGVRKVDIPTDADNQQTTPKEDSGGLTNPACDIDKPKDPTNPCGAFQIIEAVSKGLSDDAIPGISQLAGGLSTISQKLTDTQSGGAFAIKSLADTLGCATTKPAGATGPLVGPATGLSGNPCSQPITVGGSATCANPFQDKLPVARLECNLIINALLGGVDLQAPLPAVKQSGLTQSLFSPLKLTPTDPPTPTDDSGLAAVLGTYYPAAFNTAVIPGLKTAADGLVELNANITTKLSGDPDLDTTKDTTATGIVMQTRNSLAFGGIGSDLYPGNRCTGYAVTGVPSSGLNENADADSVEETCAAGDVLNIALFGTDAIEEGVSFTLLEGISETLLEGVGTFSPGCDPTKTLACAAGTLAAGGVQLNEGVNGPMGLVYGTTLLADGLPAAVDGAGRLKTEGADVLQKSGNDNSKEAGLALATFKALQAKADTGLGVPGGAPEGVTQYSGVYAFELAGAGGSATQNAARGALGLLALIAAGAAGALIASRAATP